MEIVCKHCNTRHYLSDDKIPLATKIGKCKHCHADIIVLGKNDISSPTTHSIPPEQQASKRCDFCGEKILATAKKCKYCSSLLNGSVSASQNVLEKTIKPATEHTVLPTQVKPHTKKTPIFLIVGSLLAIGGLITAFMISKQNLTVTSNEQPNTTATLTPEPIKKANDTPRWFAITNRPRTGKRTRSKSITHTKRKRRSGF